MSNEASALAATLPKRRVAAFRRRYERGEKIGSLVKRFKTSRLVIEEVLRQTEAVKPPPVSPEEPSVELETFDAESLLLAALKRRCKGRHIRLGRMRKLRRCVSVTNEGDLDLDMTYALRFTFDTGETYDAPIYQKIFVAPPFRR